MLSEFRGFLVKSNALALAVGSDWEKGLDRRRHVIVMFTDAPAHTGLSCRLYSTTQGLVGAPTVADLMEALKCREAMR